MLVEVTRFESLTEAQAFARAAIDARAEEVRVLFLTPGSGQALEYQSAVEEARLYMQGAPGAYPMLEADVAAGMAADLTGAAQLVLATRAQWEAVGAAIRTIRLGHKRQVDAATTTQQVNQIRQSAFAAFDQVVAAAAGGA